MSDDDIRRLPTEKVPVTISGRGTKVLTADYVPLGGFSEYQLGVSDAMFRAFQRWSSIFDDPDNNRIPSANERKAIVGDRPLPFVEGQTVGELKRAVETYDREEWHQQLPKGWQYALGDSLATMVTDPASIAGLVATLPAQAIARPLVAGRSILGAALISEGIAGGLFASGFIPAEMALSKAAGEQPTTFGEAAFSALGPAAWLGALPSAALTTRSLFRARLHDSVMADMAGSPYVSERTIPTPEVVDDIKANPVVPAPPTVVREPPKPPRVELEERFKDYSGGVDQWVLDMYRGVKEAEEFGAARGLSRDSPALNAFLQAAERLTASTMQLPPDFSRRLMSALDAGHTRTPEQTALLKQYRMLDDAGELKPEYRDLALEPLPPSVAPEAPTYKVGGKDVPVQFASDVDRALFASKPGKASAARSWAKKAAGLTDEQADAAIKQVRAAARRAAQKGAAKGEPAVVKSVVKRRVSAETVAARERFARTGPPDVAAYRASELTKAIDTALAHSNPFEPARATDDPDVSAMRAFTDPDPDVERLVDLIRKKGGDETEVLRDVDDTLGAMGQCRSQ